MTQIQHGGNLLQAIEEFGGQADDWLDLSTGISPFSIDLPEFDPDVWRRLPDPIFVAQIEYKAKAFYATKFECLAVPGSQFAIQHLSEILDGDIGIVEPTYGEYAAAFGRSNRSYASLRNLREIAGVSSIILANPNNPDGRVFAVDELIGLAKNLDERGGYLVIDEAFVGADNTSSVLQSFDNAQNIIVLRSIGKFYGLAGIRLGFMFSSIEVRIKLARFRGPWSVNGPALAIADHLFSHPEITSELSQKIKKRHNEMAAVMDQSDLNIIGRNELFFLIDHPRAEELHDHLKSSRILTRIFDYNQSWMRLGLTQNQDEDNRLLEAARGFKST